MSNNKAPVTEYPGRAKAIIEPHELLAKCKRIPERCVLCYFIEVIEDLVEKGILSPIGKLHGEGKPTSVYRMGNKSEEIAVCFPGVGAPLAAASLEELIGMGAKMFTVCGGAGVLDGSIPAATTIIPIWALRDEGTSYHYLQASRTCRPHKTALEAIRAACLEHKKEFIEGGTWTTDGIYRETHGAIRRRRAEGCITVEMEAAALFAVARFRKVALGQILYAGDDVSGARWDHRHWTDLRATRLNMFYLAKKACELMEV